MSNNQAPEYQSRFDCRNTSNLFHHLHVFTAVFSAFLALCLSTNVAAEDYKNREDVKTFAREFAKEHNKNEAEVLILLEQGSRKQSILDAISRPAERVLNWGGYRNIFLEPNRIKQGVAFWKEHETLINEVSKKYEVSPEIIVAILGVETRYGRLTGGYRVLDALMTLGFDYPPRAKFFRGQLEQFILLADEQNLKATDLKGSYAGAMGYGQFIPGSYRAYAVDHDGDNVADIWGNPADAIASVANYFKRHRWQYGELVAVPLLNQTIAPDLISKSPKPDRSVGDLREAGVAVPAALDNAARVSLLAFETDDGLEYWLGFDNFYVITRYNHSRLYAMAAHQLAEILRAQMTVKE
ncbi:Membrane-bound lytic murein transglycosylase B [BD1-7 clade bacterium]|uniref:Membrane-bound lytic murein transglycosylase B n=1 Tax=BD1-7 clade bacterium TaxID=2029982 RepID=A0A5S9PV14_9GAMM|nr:Membrane-bound lytic murein transglycosylase B [BD1-7 clade bacterium]CAA0108929.1 Membrane-bound lytic murein transglycosylase B [BD1-7 clade bacterium]